MTDRSKQHLSAVNRVRNKPNSTGNALSSGCLAKWC